MSGDGNTGGSSNNDTYKSSREIGLTTQYSKTRDKDIAEEKLCNWSG